MGIILQLIHQAAQPIDFVLACLSLGELLLGCVCVLLRARCGLVRGTRLTLGLFGPVSSLRRLILRIASRMRCRLRVLLRLVCGAGCRTELGMRLRQQLAYVLGVLVRLLARAAGVIGGVLGLGGVIGRRGGVLSGLLVRLTSMRGRLL